MANLFSLSQLAGGFDPRAIANQRRQAEQENALAKILGEQQVQRNDAALRGIQLDNTEKARRMSQKPSNTFKTVKGRDGNSYQVEVAPNGQLVGQPTMVEGLGAAPNNNPLDKVPEGARQYLPPELIADPNSVDRATFNKAVVDAIGQSRSAPKPRSQDDFSNASKLRGEITKATKDFRTIEGAYSRVQASATDPSAAGDLALIFNYMKVLDPGSTVREGEFATAQNAGGVDSKVAGLYNQVMNGKRLTDAQRGDFVTRAGKLFEGQKSLADKRTENIVAIGARFNIPREDLITANVSDLSDADLDAALAELE